MSRKCVSTFKTYLTRRKSGEKQPLHAYVSEARDSNFLSPQLVTSEVHYCNVSHTNADKRFI